MSLRFTVSSYRPADARTIRGIYPEFFGDYSRKLRRGSLFVAHHEGRAIGFLFIAWLRGPPYFDALVAPAAEIDEVHVRGEYRGRGVGTSLVRRALREAIRRGCKAVYLETDDFNLAARRVYERCGFRYHNLVIRYRWRVP
jgi:GNAT superfamily N-acetyltransferase